jgi:hypothetical protein
MKTAFVLGALALFASTAVAHVTVDLTAADGSIYYVPDDGDAVGAATGGPSDLTIYEESNGCEDLQTQPVDCMGDEELEPADTTVLAL